MQLTLVVLQPLLDKRPQAGENLKNGWGTPVVTVVRLNLLDREDSSTVKELIDRNVFARLHGNG